VGDWPTAQNTADKDSRGLFLGLVGVVGGRFGHLRQGTALVNLLAFARHGRNLFIDDLDFTGRF
jgi:hypothetical protein